MLYNDPLISRVFIPDPPDSTESGNVDVTGVPVLEFLEKLPTGVLFLLAENVFQERYLVLRKGVLKPG